MKKFAGRDIKFDITDGHNKRLLWYNDSYEVHRISHPDIKPYVHLVPNILNLCEEKEAVGNFIHYYHPVKKNRKGKQVYLEVIVSYNPDPANIVSAHLTTNKVKIIIKV